MEKPVENHTEQKIDNMQSALRGEISAVEACEKVLKALDSSPERIRLQEFIDDHKMARDYWAKEVNSEMVTPEDDSGVWGLFVKSFTGSATLFGNSTALAALKRGVEYGHNFYKDMLEDTTLDPAHRNMIKNTFIPRQQKQLISVEAMRQMQ